MDKMIFLNVGWMSDYSGPGQISGGGKYVTIRRYGHEMMNFKPFAGKMYGTAVTPHYGALNLRKLGATRDAEFVDGVLVLWVAKSRIVGWYKHARVYRRSQPSPKGSGRSYKGDPINYRVTAKASDCKVLNPDDRHFPVPRAGERKHAMGRYIWYADGPSNSALRAKVIRYVASGGKISDFGKPQQPTIGGSRHQLDPLARAKVEQAAILLTTRHFEDLDYVVNSVELDNVGWDLNAIHPQSGVRLQLETKGFSGGEINVEMTPNEYKMMSKHKGTYRICVGTNCLKKSLRRLAIFAFNDTSQTWVDGSDRALQIKELKSARLRLLNE